MKIDLEKLIANRLEKWESGLREIEERNRRAETRRRTQIEELKEGLPNRFRERAARLLEIVNGEYLPARLHAWFLLDNWTVQEGLVLLSGLDPAYVPFEENGRMILPDLGKDSVSSLRYKHSDLRWVRTLDNIRLFDGDTEDILGEDFVQRLSFDFKWIHVRLLRIWNSGDHIAPRYPPKYFIDWAINKGVEIDWLDWAKANGYYRAIPETKADEEYLTQDEVAPKSAKSYLNIIGALVELYWGAAHDGEEYSQAALLSELRQYKGFAGMSERNLKDKLTKALRAIKEVD